MRYVGRQSLLRLGSIAICVLVAIGACGPGSTSTSTSSGKVSGTVTYWDHFTSDNEMQGLAEVIKAFHTSHPDATINAETVPNPDYMSKVTTAVQANQRPDAAMVAVERAPDMVSIKALLPLTNRLKAWSGYNDYPKSIWGPVTFNGQLYAIPAFAFVDVLYYRVDWFKEAGLTPPKTWDEFEKDAIALTNKSKGRYGFALRGGAGGAGWLQKVLESWGVTWLDNNGKVNTDRAKLRQALDFYTRLATTDHVVPPSAAQDGYTQTVDGFKTGQTAMLFQSTGALGDIEASPGLKPGVEFATAPMPTGPGGSSGRVDALYNGIMSDRNLDAAWAWITQWSDVQSQIAFMKTTGYFPCSISAQKDPAIANDPILGPAAQAAAVGVPSTTFKGLPAFQANDLLPNLQAVLTRQKTVDQATDSILAGLAKETQ